MKYNIIKNILRISIICILVSMVMSNLILITGNYSLGEANFDGVIVNDRKTVNTTDIENTSARIIGVIQTVGILIAVGVVMVLGIKYMMGSAEEKAEYKKTMVPYLIGAIVLFAASALAGGIYNMIDGFNN